MKQKIFWMAGGVIGGLVLAMVLLFALSADIMMNEQVSKYDFDKATELFETSVSEHGWVIPAVHDLQGSMNKFGYEVDAVKVYEICNSEHASRILLQDDERIVSSMMPCRVSIYRKSDGKTYVSTMNTGLMGRLFGGLISDVMKDASAESANIVSEIL